MENGVKEAKLIVNESKDKDEDTDDHHQNTKIEMQSIHLGHGILLSLIHFHLILFSLPLMKDLIVTEQPVDIGESLQSSGVNNQDSITHETEEPLNSRKHMHEPSKLTAQEQTDFDLYLSKSMDPSNGDLMDSLIEVVTQIDFGSELC